METHEWLYSELLDLFKEKEKEESHYLPIELELPLEPPQPIGDERVSDDQQKDRGVIIIDL